MERRASAGAERIRDSEAAEYERARACVPFPEKPEKGRAPISGSGGTPRAEDGWRGWEGGRRGPLLKV